MGFLAQDLIRSLPEAVQSIQTIKGGVVSNKYLGVRYDEVIPVLVEAIRELDEKTKLQLNGDDAYVKYESKVGQRSNISASSLTTSSTSSLYDALAQEIQELISQDENIDLLNSLVDSRIARLESFFHKLPL